MIDASPTDQPVPSIRVLVCDDQVLVRTGLVTIFSAQPDLVVVGEATDGIAAVSEARRLEPDVVVMDVRMPGLDGIEATRRIAGPEVAEPIKVLVVTTFNLDDYVYEALRAGASGFLLKDSGPMQLVEAVRTVAAGESLLSPAVTRALVGRFASRVAPTTTPASGRTTGANAGADDVLNPLSPRESEVLKLIAAGMSNAEISAALFITHETVKTYVSRILTKLDLRDRVHAVIYAYRNGIVNAEA